jgi:hypothetical protein
MRIPEISIIGTHPEAKNQIGGRCTLGRADREEHKIILRTRGITLRSLRHTIAHELIHLAFPRLQHGVAFEEYIAALLKGHMAFDRRGLITEVVKPQPPLDSRVAELI